MRVVAGLLGVEVATRGGELGIVVGANPAAGAEMVDTVPIGERWLLLSLMIELITAATAANRRVRFRFTDGTNEFYRGVAGSAQTASRTIRYSGSPGGAEHAVRIDEMVLSLPNRMLLGPGFTIETRTDSLQAGDNYGAPSFLRERYFV